MAQGYKEMDAADCVRANTALILPSDSASCWFFRVEGAMCKNGGLFVAGVYRTSYVSVLGHGRHTCH